MTQAKYKVIRENLKGILILLSVAFLLYGLIYYLIHHNYDSGIQSLETLGYDLGNLICFFLLLSSAYRFSRKLHDRRSDFFLDFLSVATLLASLLWNFVGEIRREEISDSGLHMVPGLLLLFAISLLSDLSWEGNMMTDTQKNTYLVLRKRMHFGLAILSVVFLIFFLVFYIRYGEGLRNAYEDPVNGLIREDIPIGLFSAFLFNFFCFLTFFSCIIHFRRKLKNVKVNVVLDVLSFLILLTSLQLTLVFDFMEAFDMEMKLLPVMFILFSVVSLTNLY